MNSFELTGEGRSNLPINIKPYDTVTLVPVTFKVDTGADLTTISKKVLIRLGYSQDWLSDHIQKDSQCTLSRAGSTAKEAFYVIIPKANILGVDLVNWPFYVMKEWHRDFPNLLGVNVLTNFNFSFNYEDWFFTIDSIQRPKKELLMLAGQCIETLMTSNVFN